jgi:hypothetical protein
MKPVAEGAANVPMRATGASTRAVIAGSLATMLLIATLATATAQPAAPAYAAVPGVAALPSSTASAPSAPGPVPARSETAMQAYGTLNRGNA